MMSEMTWDTRVVQQNLKGKRVWFSVREVFYNDKREIMGYTEEPVTICGETVEEMREYLQWCLKCLDKDILVEGKFKVVGFDEPKRRPSKKTEAPK